MPATARYPDDAIEGQSCRAEPSDQSVPRQLEINISSPSIEPEFELEMARLEETKKQQQRENEIASAIRCLATNFLLCFAFLTFYLLMAFFNKTLTAIALSLFKTLVPVIATISNFVKIHSLLQERFQNLKKDCFSRCSYGG